DPEPPPRAPRPPRFRPRATTFARPPEPHRRRGPARPPPAQGRHSPTRPGRRTVGRRQASATCRRAHPAGLIHSHSPHSYTNPSINDRAETRSRSKGTHLLRRVAAIALLVASAAILW